MLTASICRSVDGHSGAAPPPQCSVLDHVDRIAPEPPDHRHNNITFIGLAVTVHLKLAPHVRLLYKAINQHHYQINQIQSFICQNGQKLTKKLKWQ